MLEKIKKLLGIKKILKNQEIEKSEAEIKMAECMKVNMEIIKKNEEKQKNEKLEKAIKKENKYSFFTDVDFEFNKTTGYAYYTGEFFKKIEIKNLSFTIGKNEKENIGYDEDYYKGGALFFLLMPNFVTQYFCRKENALRCGKEIADFIKEYDAKN
jgi:hypothetical protein